MNMIIDHIVKVYTNSSRTVWKHDIDLYIIESNAPFVLLLVQRPFSGAGTRNEGVSRFQGVSINSTDHRSLSRDI